MWACFEFAGILAAIPVAVIAIGFCSATIDFLLAGGHRATTTGSNADF
jgi:hypothetical protein